MINLSSMFNHKAGFQWRMPMMARTRLAKILDKAKELDRNAFPVHAASVILCMVGDVMPITRMYRNSVAIAPLNEQQKRQYGHDSQACIEYLTKIKEEVLKRHSYLGEEKLRKLFSIFDAIYDEYIATHKENGVTIYGDWMIPELGIPYPDLLR